MLKVLEIALAEANAGYLEKASNKDLDDPKANAGFNNYTKYARDLDKLGDFYNNAKQGYAWCEVFVDWCMYKAYGEDMALKLLCQPKKSAGAGCTQSASYYRSKGQFYKTPQVGDQIFFTWGGEVEHTGLVYKVTSSTVFTVEGNTNGKDGLIPNGGGVYTKAYSRSSSIIYGYGRPNYSLAPNNGEATAASAPTTTKPIDTKPSTTTSTDKGEYEMKVKQLKKGSTGTQVKTVQALLIKKFGISLPVYGVDGDFGAETLAGVKTFQSRNKLTVDGIVGEKTWKKLLGVE